MLQKEAIVIRITGDSGDGIQLVGEQLTISAASLHDVRTMPDFPAEIRAPAGTVAGVSGFQLAMSEAAIFTAGETLDILVAMNPAALKHSLAYLKPRGLLILNEDSFQEKDWQKAGVGPEFLAHQAEHYQVISLPLITKAMLTQEGSTLTKPQAKKTKNFYVLGLVLWLFDLPLENCQNFIHKKFENIPEIAEANLKSLLAGYSYAETLELSRKDFILGHMHREPGDYRQITGVEAIGLALATLATGTKTPMFVSGYPITPASAILHECTRLHDYGVELLQAEDEIAAICACIGASYAGQLALTCTSGPGFDLKSESLGLAIVAELPLVLLDIQRAGASTGLPTKTGQSDLRQALYGRHGEAPLPVLAAHSPSDCFYTVIEAFTIAIKYMTPVIVLLDAYLVNAAEPWRIPEISDIRLPEIKYNRSEKPYQRDEHLSRSWNIPGSHGFIYQAGGLEKQGEEGKVSYDADNHQKMVQIRADKIAGIAEDYDVLQMEGDLSASLVVVSWGSTLGSMKSMLAECHQQGLPVALLHLRHLNPLPEDLGGLLHTFEKVLVAELNSGQLCQILRAEYLINAESINQCNGQPFHIGALIQAIQKEVCHEYHI